ncbi:MULTISPECIES: LacI family DNA-binding transcriptional regulator [unclassified Iodidimonas]|jgi:LacI family transcriptional regulator|uniref:LacI family DNA-binding transcriptional regulator n=1 Tax=unclassified Iodidimonas TaxID=2626145 RepID=UPI002482B6DC|nr:MULTISPECIES: LacI family DNA-binding transcriptional regulator [unclassified Iodidimonas]
MARARATLRDVAERCDVHLSTVSRVLNNKKGYAVSEEVADRIRRMAAELGYKTNPFAYSLRVNRSFTVGVLIPDLSNPIFPPLIRGIEHRLEQSGYTAILGDTDNRVEEERRIVERLKARQTDGLILATAHRADDLIRSCIDEGYHVVLINRSLDDDAVASVVNDDGTGIAMAVRHLLDQGHRRIAHIAGPQEISTGFRRYLAFKEAMKKEGLTPDEDLIAFCHNYSEKEGFAALRGLFEREKPFTAVVAANDLLALGCYDAITEAGLSCPEDISVTGYNDMPFSDKFKPPLTTVHIPLHKMGEEAASAMLKLIEQAPDKTRQHMVTPHLVVRGSTAKCSEI